MKIVTWNCNGGFRKKFERIFDLNADIYIIQECENAEYSQYESFKKHIENYFWTGENKNKGIGIFVKQGIKMDSLNWNNLYRGRKLKYFLPVLINNKFTLLAVWNHKADAEAFGYIGQFWLYLQNNKEKFTNIVIAGDFNSNSIWDSWDRWWNHSDCVRELQELNIYSSYHLYFEEKQGSEKINTFFHRKNIEKGYHIDYIFTSKEFLNSVYKICIENIKKWIDISDHVPLILNIADSIT
jgi:exonuclease III